MIAPPEDAGNQARSWVRGKETQKGSLWFHSR
jgi:hypothetical protein